MLNIKQCIWKIFLLLFLVSFFTTCKFSSEPEWKIENGYRWKELPLNYFGSSGFKKLNHQNTGIDFENRVTESQIAENRYYLNGAGVAAGDVNGDGLVDIYFTSLNGPNRLYRNLGDMRFDDISSQAGVTHEGFHSTGATFADVNGNGHLDLLVSAMDGENTLYLNNGNGTFNLKEDSGLGKANGSMTMALADINGNGYLDLYITNYKEISAKDLYSSKELEWENILNEPLRNPTDKYTLKSPFDSHLQLIYDEGNLVGNKEIGEFDELYLNRGGKFEKVLDTKEYFLDENGKPFGLQPDWGLTAKFQDLNNDGLQDLYVCNDFHTPDRIWINQGNSTFRAIPINAIRNITFSCMGVDFSDINRDGELDIFTTGMLSPHHQKRLSQVNANDPSSLPIGGIQSRPIYNRNSMYLKREDNTYAEITYLSGTQATGWSWSTRFMDINLNGFEDIIITTGYPYDVLDIDSQYAMRQNGQNIFDHFMNFISITPSLNLPNRILRNNKDLTFTEVGNDWGFSIEDVSQGMAVADLDGDGALDLIINRMNNKATIYRNTTIASRIAVRLKGESPNTKGIGAKVELQGGPVIQQKEVSAGGDYLSGSDTMLMFAADEKNYDHKLIVRWPDGRQTKIENIQANRVYEVDQATAISPKVLNSETTPLDTSFVYFEDISNQLDHTHHEIRYDDFQIQPLLPWRLSQLGPGVAWLDITNDGTSEILIGTGRNGNLSVFNWTGESFKPLQLDKLTTDDAPGDQTTLIGWHEEENTRIVVGSANFEQGHSRVASAYDYRITPEGIVQKDSIPGDFSTTGPMAAADVNGDGWIDLFIGGRFKPGRYPENADSRLFLNQSGQFRVDKVSNQLFENMGLVTGAVFSDLTGNGWPDLLITNEWGSLRLFANTEGKFREITGEVGLDHWHGWWQGVATGDFTGNGKMDIVATNIGLNSQWQLSDNRELRMYYYDLNVDGMVNIIESYYDKELDSYVPRRQMNHFRSLQIPLNHMNSHTEFANKGLDDILGNWKSRVPYKHINTLKHMVFINNGQNFQGKSLPIEAQFSVGFHIGVADINNNGMEDLFLSQNLFSLPRKTPRQDAGRGILMFGDGKGNFETISGSKSGIKLYGEQRGAAFGDFDHDGRIDLVVSQNGAPTRLFRNQIKKQGYRIKLTGTSSNRNGIGSQIRLIYDDGRKGPVREIQAGSGYWSQSDFTQVLGAYSSNPHEIEIRWYDGIYQSFEIEPGQYNFVISHPNNNQ